MISLSFISLSSCDIDDLIEMPTCKPDGKAENLTKEHRNLLEVAGWLKFVEDNVGRVNYIDADRVHDNAIGTAECGSCVINIATRDMTPVGIAGVIVHEAAHLADKCENGEDPARKAASQFHEDYRRNYSAMFYEKQPDINNCFGGVLKDSEKQIVLDKINQIRNLHGLKSVQYSYSDDIYSNKAALLMVANNSFNFTQDSKCWSWEGDKGSSWQWDNVTYTQYGVIMSTPDYPNDGENWVINSFKDYSGVESSLWRRRNLLDPQLAYISFGRVDGKPIVGEDQNFMAAIAIRLTKWRGEYISHPSVDFIAYPYNNYPNTLMNDDTYLSFSVLSDRSSFWNNDDKYVNFSNATIEVFQENGSQVQTNDITYDNEWNGIPNLIKWKMIIIPNTKYTVNIKNVKIINSFKDYSYWFRLQ